MSKDALLLVRPAAVEFTESESAEVVCVGDALPQPHPMTEGDYVDSCLSFVRECDCQHRETKLVKAGKDHQCACLFHVIRKGEWAVRDKILMDDQWGSCYVCLPCLKLWHVHRLRESMEQP